MPGKSSARTEAVNAGLAFYITGKACKRGHFAKRSVRDHQCVECGKLKDLKRDPAIKKAILKKSREKNYPLRRAEILANNIKWREANPEKYKQSCLATRASHRERARAKSKQWRLDNPKKVRDHSNRYTGLRRSAEGTFNREDIDRIRDAQKDKCAICKCRLRGSGHLDHIIALSKGGSNWPRNLQWLCQKCNVTKSARDPIEFMQSLGRLL